MTYDFDWIVVGSGFGGSASALRLTEKGYSVGVLECGRRYRDRDFAKSAWNLRRYFWAPKLGLKGILRMTLFKDLFIVSGCGVRGGSLGFANTLYQPKRGSRFYSDPQWAELGDWHATLDPHYRRAERILGVTTYEGEARLRVFGYRDLLVCDGAAIPANVGVNPSLTIAALAEHAMSHVPEREETALSAVDRVTPT